MGHVWRGLVGTTAMGLGFTALGLLPLPEATALGYAAPLLTVIFAAMFLGEQVRVFRLTAVVVGLVGVVIVLLPRLTVDLGRRRLEAADHRRHGGAARRGLRGARPGLRAQAGAYRGDGGDRLLLLGHRRRCCRSLTLPFGWVVPTPREAVLLVGAGLLGGIGQILLTESYRHAETGVIAPFEYVSMLLALILGYADLRARCRPGAMLVGAGADRRRRALHHLARAPARHPAGRRAQGA